MDTRRDPFENLVRAYSAELYRYACWLCRQPGQAEDLVQEVFLRAWKSMDSLRDAGAARAWLYTILRNVYHRQWRKDRRHGMEMGLDDATRLLEEAGETHRLDSQTLYRALEQLPVEYSEPLVLQVLGGFSSKEIGAILGLRQQNVLTRAFRARQMLRKLIAAESTSSSTHNHTR